MPDPVDLSLVENEVLIQELLSRYDHTIFMGVIITKLQEASMKGACSDIISIRRWEGNSYTCAGMAASMERSILENYAAMEKVVDENKETP